MIDAASCANGGAVQCDGNAIEGVHFVDEGGDAGPATAAHPTPLVPPCRILTVSMNVNQAMNNTNAVGDKNTSVSDSGVRDQSECSLCRSAVCV